MAVRIKIDSGITSHWLWNDAELLKWWLDLLLLASQDDQEVLHDSHKFTLLRGQLLASAAFLAKRWKRSRPIVIRFLRQLEDDNMITRQTLFRSTPLIAIANFDRYCNKPRKRKNQSKAACSHSADEAPQQAQPEQTEAQPEQTEAQPEQPQSQPEQPQSEPLPARQPDRRQPASRDIANNEKYKLQMSKDESWLEVMAMRYHLSRDDLLRQLTTFWLDQSCRDKAHDGLRDAKQHFNNWLLVQQQKQQENDNNINGRKPQNRRRGVEATLAAAEDYKTAF